MSARRPELLDTSLDSYTMGALLELAHQLDMPALTLRIKRILLPSSRYLEERTYSKPPPGNYTDLMRVSDCRSSPSKPLQQGGSLVEKSALTHTALKQTALHVHAPSEPRHCRGMPSEVDCLMSMFHWCW